MLCLDTMILIWGVQKVAKPQQRFMIERTERFLDHLGANETIMVPSVALGEYLTGFRDVQVQKRQFASINSRFFVPAFDPECAALAAELAVSPEAQQLFAAGERRTVKADLQIIATAIVHGADAIVTANVQEYVKLARNRIQIKDVPDVHVQRPFEFDAGAAN